MDDNKKGNDPASKEEIKTAASPETPSVPANSEPKPDPLKMAEELGALKKEKEEYLKQWSNAEPVLRLVYEDPEVNKAATEAWNKRNNPKPAGDNKPETPKEDKKETAPVSLAESDNRNALIGQAVNDFNKTHGLDKLSTDDRKNLNIAIMGELKGLLDPNDTGKSGAQLLEGISVARVPEILNKAYYLATREEREKVIREKAKSDANSEATGLIGAMPSGSAESEEITLTEPEKKIAERLGLKEDDYLKNKKEIAKRNGSIY